MVALQTESVEEVVEVFRSMNESMQSLIEGLKKIAASTERADDERSHAVEAVRYISDIIEENASNAETVSGIASNLFEKVESLNRTSNVLGENMTGLKREIEAFKTEEQLLKKNNLEMITDGRNRNTMIIGTVLTGGKICYETGTDTD